MRLNGDFNFGLLFKNLVAVICFSLATLAFATEPLDALVKSAGRFSAAIQQQLATVQNNPAPAKFAERTIEYAQAKTTYFAALRAAMPELINIATGKEPRPVQTMSLFCVTWFAPNTGPGTQSSRYTWPHSCMPLPYRKAAPYVNRLIGCFCTKSMSQFGSICFTATWE